MPTYIYDKIVTPPIDRQSLSKVARISYWKAYGEEPPGWLVGLGVLNENRFILKEEFIAPKLSIKTSSYGMVGFQTPQDGMTVDRGWILVPYKNVFFDGEHCVIE
jgi:hypothetical protein